MGISIVGFEISCLFELGYCFIIVADFTIKKA